MEDTKPKILRAIVDPFWRNGRLKEYVSINLGRGGIGLAETSKDVDVLVIPMVADLSARAREPLALESHLLIVLDGDAGEVVDKETQAEILQAFSGGSNVGVLSVKSNSHSPDVPNAVKRLVEPSLELEIASQFDLL